LIGEKQVNLSRMNAATERRFGSTSSKDESQIVAARFKLMREDRISNGGHAMMRRSLAPNQWASKPRAASNLRNEKGRNPRETEKESKPA